MAVLFVCLSLRARVMVSRQQRNHGYNPLTVVIHDQDHVILLNAQLTSRGFDCTCSGWEA
jgi:hypothetical protein